MRRNDKYQPFMGQEGERMAVNALFEPCRLGRYVLANRIVMSPMTRNRSPGEVPNELNAEYYAQRASAGLVITESTAISPQGLGWIDSPGLYTPDQISGWRRVTDVVHVRGGRIFAQLWHTGRCSHVSIQPGGQAPVAPSAVRSLGRSRTHLGRLEHSPPRALAIEEIPGVIEQYRQAAANALDAGFDGVEVHAGNGYLIDQFLRDCTNHRIDAYGGAPESRARLMWEVTRVVAEVCGQERTGIRISPTNTHHNMQDSDPERLFLAAISGLRDIGLDGLAYLHVVEGATPPDAPQLPFDYRALRRLFGGTYIANNGYTPERANDAVSEGHADLVAFGKLYVANPDLVERLRAGASLNSPDLATLYDGGAHGYTDYPLLAVPAAP
jgi:N-ethylmaleimide reductase